ncbi:heavy metal transporter [Microbacterium invictum]|uniref:Heavy metal transporter n=1 Tax=Microbacterium invictum TaxID=515415 RepID=A0AA40VNF8_9MICO|nr:MULTISPECIES: heavy metal transporter [Microbacterium]MBB4140388.1 hypothetical protein [Microbacterium invictum]
MTDPPRRVRVTADTTVRRVGPSTRGIALPGAPVDEADAVYARALRRSQLRLALGTVAGFVVVGAALAAAIALIPELNDIVLLGVPLSWLLHAFAFYPVILGFALLYARAAGRNERLYRALRERE